MLRRSIALLLCSLVTGPNWAQAVTAVDLSGRLVLDGSTSEWHADESLFGTNPSGSWQEPPDDSRWGPNNDVSQVRVTWDALNLYLAVDAVIWGNNLLLYVDCNATRGVPSMRLLNSWARNVDFAPGFQPDAFVGTWDTNPSPRLLLDTADGRVEDLQVAAGLHAAAATFDQGSVDRAMEVRIPWTTLARHGALSTRDSMVNGLPTVVLPHGLAIHFAALVTAAADWTGGFDSAPNNTIGFSSDAWATAVIDNWVTIVVDADQDGLADMGVSPRNRASIHDPSTGVHRATWSTLKLRYR